MSGDMIRTELGAGEAGMTALSAPLRGVGHSRCARAMARLSLFTSLGTVSCIDAPPEYSVPDRMPPVIVAALVVPPTTRIISAASSPGTLTFTVPFRADDSGVGEGLHAHVVRDTDIGALPIDDGSAQLEPSDRSSMHPIVAPSSASLPP